MRYIPKGPEPRSLLTYRLTPHATYAGLPQDVKEALRERLVREQGFLCCYCMQRIEPEAEGMKIEHWASQSNPSTHHRELEWKNLLGACKGGECSPQRQQHCDTHKGDTPITLNPTEEGCERFVHFLGDGTIRSDDSAINEDLDRTLNLNQARLKNNRKAVLDAFLQAMRRKYPPGATWTDTAMRRELEGLRQPDANSRLTEYCQVPVYWLMKRMGRHVGTQP